MKAGIDRTTIEEVLEATRIHLRALRAVRRKGRISPCYWPRYNGAVEYAQRELKIVARILRDHHGLPLQQALVLAPGIINARPRPILHGATANDVFHAPRTAFAQAFTTESRRVPTGYTTANALYSHA
jgi:hypothetical protein